MEQNSSCEANRSSASQEIPPFLRNLEFHYFFKKETATCHYTEADKSSPVQSLKIRLNIILSHTSRT